MQSTAPIPRAVSGVAMIRRPLPRNALTAAFGLALLALMGGGFLTGCAPFPPQASRGSFASRPPAFPRTASITDHGFVSVLADTPGATVITVNSFDLQDHHIAAWQPADARFGPTREAGIWLPPGRHVVEVQYVRDIATGVSLTRGQVPFAVKAGHTYIVRPQVRSDFGKVSFAVIDHGTDFPAQCLPWSIQQARRALAANGGVSPGRPAGVTGADILACRQNRPY